MKKKISILALIAFCVLSFGMTTKAQIYAIDLKFYVRASSGGPFTIQVGIEDYLNNVYDITQLLGTWAANTEFTLTNPWYFQNIPLPPGPPYQFNYCRVVMSATYNGTTKYGASGWTTPDIYGYIYPGTVRISFN